MSASLVRSLQPVALRGDRENGPHHRDRWPRPRSTEDPVIRWRPFGARGWRAGLEGERCLFWISGSPVAFGSAEPRGKERVEGGRVARRHADRSFGSRAAEGSKARAGRSDRRRNDRASRRQSAEGARRVLRGRACTVTDGSSKCHERRSSRKASSRREEHLEEQRIPMRGATVGEANSRTDGTRLRTEQGLEVEELGSWQPACG